MVKEVKKMSVYDYSIKNIERKEIPLKQFQGKVLLIFNSATRCGYTPQYEGLETLYEKYHEKGLEVIDLPCNQFMNQAPGSDQEIANFCQVNYNTTFETYAKIKVNGSDELPLYTYLKSEKPNDEMPGKENEKPSLKEKLLGPKIKWNFTKFIIDRNGNVYGRYGSKVTPSELEQVIEKLL
jgi:glutathione peroxidase